MGLEYIELEESVGFPQCAVGCWVCDLDWDVIVEARSRHGIGKDGPGRMESQGP